MGPEKKKVSFWANKVEKIPVKIKFKTSDGRSISFTGTKAVSHKEKVKFMAKKKK